jgi:hypothetical protein
VLAPPICFLGLPVLNSWGHIFISPQGLALATLATPLTPVIVLPIEIAIWDLCPTALTFWNREHAVLFL